MKTYARIVGGLATDVTATDPYLIFHPLVAAEFYVVPDGTVADQPMNEADYLHVEVPAP